MIHSGYTSLICLKSLQFIFCRKLGSECFTHTTSLPHAWTQTPSGVCVCVCVCELSWASNFERNKIFKFPSSAQSQWITSHSSLPWRKMLVMSFKNCFKRSSHLYLCFVTDMEMPRCFEGIRHWALKRLCHTQFRHTCDDGRQHTWYVTNFANLS